MIPILTTTTDQNEGIGRLVDAISCDVTEELNGEYTATVLYPTSAPLAGEFRAGRMIRLRTGEGWQSFDIQSVRRQDSGYIKAVATHISYRLNYIHVRPCSVTASTLTELMSQLVDNCVEDCPFAFSSSISWVKPWTFRVTTPTSLRAVIGGDDDSLISRLNLIMRWDGFNVEMNHERNADAGPVAVRYGQSITSLDAEDDLEDLTTAILPYYLDRDGVYVEGAVARCDTADDWLFDRVTPVDFTSDFDTAPTAADLDEAAEAYLTDQKVGAFESSIDVDLIQSGLVSDTASLGIGTPLKIIHRPLGIVTESTIVESVYNVLRDRYTSLTAGARRDTLAKVIARQKSTSKTTEGGTVTVTGVRGVKGSAETAFRTGNVSLSPEQIGALGLDGGTLTGSLRVATDGSTTAALLRETDDGRGNLQLSRTDGSLAANIYAAANGAEVDLLNASAAMRASMYVTASDAGALRLYAADGSYSTLTANQLAALLPLADGVQRVTGTTRPAVDGVSWSGFSVYSDGRVVWVKALITLTDAGVSDSWLTVATGLPIPPATVWVAVPGRASTYSRPLDLQITTDGDLKIRYGASSGWMYMANIAYMIT